MNRIKRQSCQSMARLGVVMVAFTLLALLLVSVRPAHADDSPEVHLIGVILAAPDDEGGIGAWTIEGRVDGEGEVRAWIVIADDETDFHDGVLAVGDRAKVEGLLNGDDELVASEFARADGEGGNDRDPEGVVLTAPESATGIGAWTIQTDRDQALTVTADANTRFDDGIPLVGDWVEVRGPKQPDGSILATRIKLDEYENSELVVRLEAGVISATVASRYGLLPHATVLASGDIYLLTSDEELDDLRGLLVQIEQDSDVIWAEPNYVGGAPVGDPYRTWGWGGAEPTEYVNQTAFAQINLDVVGDQYPGAEIIVAVLDTGIDLGHPAFVGRILPGLDLIDDDTTPDEVGNGFGWGHGTHTSGVIAKVAPGAQLLPVRVLDTNARGNTFLVAYGIEWAVDQGADVINLSLGTPHDSKVLHEAIDQARQQGVIVVAAVGNDDDDIPQYPAAYSGVIGVTAVDGENVKADFANYGEQWVDIAAPGVGIVSTIIGEQGSGYATWSGTSMAVPFVTGVAARLRDQQADGAQGPIRQKLIGNAVDINVENPDHIDQLGGLLDVAAALGIENDAVELPLNTYLPLVVR